MGLPWQESFGELPQRCSENYCCLFARGEASYAHKFEQQNLKQLANVKT